LAVIRITLAIPYCSAAKIAFVSNTPRLPE
jgi:hypothetical protein